MAAGESHSNAKLNWVKVDYIRDNPDRLTPSALAARFNVSRSTIHAVQQFITWNR